MRKILFLIVLFLLPVFLFGETALFRSNSMGMTIERISAFRQDEFDFVLTIADQPGMEIRTLFEQGEEIKRWETSTFEKGRREEFFASGLLDSASEYNTRGDLLEEETYVDGELSRTRKYIYEDNLLMEIIETDNQDTIISVSEFKRSGAGRMQRVVQTFADGYKKVSSYTYSSRGIIQEWHGTYEKGDLFRFDSDGETIAEEVWDGKELQLSRKFQYGEGGEYSLVEDDYLLGVIVRKLYDPEDNLRRELITKEGNLVEDTVYFYNQGTLVEKLRRQPGIRERWTFEYDEDDELVNEEHYKNEELKKVTRYTGENAYYEELFRNGDPFLRVYYEEERKIREEPL